MSVSTEGEEVNEKGGSRGYDAIVRERHGDSTRDVTDIGRVRWALPVGVHARYQTSFRGQRERTLHSKHKNWRMYAYRRPQDTNESWYEYDTSRREREGDNARGVKILG